MALSASIYGVVRRLGLFRGGDGGGLYEYRLD